LMEVSVLFTVRSRHLPEVYDAFEANGRFYLVMQLVEGQNLMQVLYTRVPSGEIGEQEPGTVSRGPCSEQEVLQWLLPIMEVLQDLHKRSHPIMHRDIKPSNIILTPSQTTVLVDFGLTRLYDPQSNTQTLVKAVSEGFSPIEQYLGKTSPASDIYAMAATMYLLLTNRVLPMPIARSVQDTLVPPRLLNPSLSPSIEHALIKALAIQADQRYQSMREFAQGLQSSTFGAFANPTIAAGPASGSGYAPSTPLILKSTPPPPPPSGYQAVSRPPQGVYGPVPNRGPQGPVSHVSQPYGYPAYPGPRPPHSPSNYAGQVHMPQAPQQARQASIVPPQSLPSPFGQGCLWGLLQGVLAGVLVAFTQDQANFYLAIVMGFLFYTLAGFMTTRKGGSFVRGGWAGFWAGINSTIIFWIVFGVCFIARVIHLLQTLSAEFPGRRPDVLFKRVWDTIRVQTALPQTVPTSSQSSLGNVGILLGVGLVIAVVLGLVGGFLGSARYKAYREKKQRGSVYP